MGLNKGQTNSSSFKKGMVPWNKGTTGIIKAWNNGKKCPQISKGLIGRKLSDEHRKKSIKNLIIPIKGIRQKGQFKKLHKPWNKNKKGVMPDPWNKGNVGLQISWMKGKHHSKKSNEKNRIAHIGKKQSKETILKRIKKGENHYNWKGGITPLNKLLRSKSMWKIWREAVFLRDNFTCQNPECEFCNNKIGVMLHPHHIKPLSLFPELTFRVDNGITYCAEFHIKSGLHIGIRNMREVC